MKLNIDLIDNVINLPFILNKPERIYITNEPSEYQY